jgi:transcriptional regulator GlxA family with amidase domain
MNAMQIGVLAYPGCFASEIFGVPDLLTMSGRVAAAQGLARDSCEVTVISPRRRVVAAGGFAIEVRALRPVDVLIVPGFELPCDAGLDITLAGLGPEVDAVRSQAGAGTAIASICVGAFLLAEAGLLDGCKATTSWLYADLLAQRYPKVSVQSGRLVVTDRGVTTAAAFSAMYDFALGFIREHAGPRVARTTARIALVDDARTTQAPYVDPGLLPSSGLPFSREVQRWLERNLSSRYDLAVLAREFHVSTRTMLRRFGEETGGTPLEYLQAARVAQARHLLESTDRTVAGIASDVGYADPGTFSGVFARHVGHRPRAYRDAFRRQPGWSADSHQNGAGAPDRRQTLRESAIQHENLQRRV